MAFEHLAQVLQRIQLYLPHTLPRHTNFLANLLERRSPVPVQAEAPLNNFALFLVQLAHPVIDDVVYIVLAAHTAMVRQTASLASDRPGRHRLRDDRWRAM